MRLLLLCLALCACSRQVQVRAEEQIQAKEDVHVVEGPETKTTTIEEFGAPPDDAPPAASGEATTPTEQVPAVGTSDTKSRPQQAPARSHSASTSGQAGLGSTLLRRTVIVEQKGPVVLDKHDTTDTTAKVAEVKKSAPSLGCAFAGWTWAVAIIAAVAGIIYLKVKR